MTTTHVLPCGHVVRVSYAQYSPALAEITRRHKRTCPQGVARVQPVPVRQFVGDINAQCLMGHKRTMANVFRDQDGVEWCRECSRLIQNGAA